jgi:hypothetical protein
VNAMRVLLGIALMVAAIGGVLLGVRNLLLGLLLRDRLLALLGVATAVVFGIGAAMLVLSALGVL